MLCQHLAFLIQKDRKITAIGIVCCFPCVIQIIAAIAAGFEAIKAVFGFL
jgi:hypothetical protein